MATAKLDTSTIWPTHGVLLGAAGALHYVPLRKTNYVVPAHFTVSFGDPRLPYDVELEVLMQDDGPQCINLNARSQSDALPISTTGLRTLPLAGLLEQGARYMAYEVTRGDDGTETVTPAKSSPEAREQITQAWRWAKAAPRRINFPADTRNLTLVGDLVRRALDEAKSEARRPRVYADVLRWLKDDGISVSRATVQRRIEEAQERELAPRWTKESS